MCPRIYGKITWIFLKARDFVVRPKLVIGQSQGNLDV